MKISVLMNCYNGEKYLEKAIGSILAQTCPDWQLIFVDNWSTDGSRKIFERMQDSRMLYCQPPEHMDLGGAREFGLGFCDGDYLCFLDTDDCWLPDKLEKQLQLMEENRELVLCYGSFYWMDEQDNIYREFRKKEKQGNLFPRNLANYEVNFQTLMIRRSALERVEKPYFDPFFQFSPDYNLVLQLLLTGDAAEMDDFLVRYRRTGNSLTGKTVSRWGLEMEHTLDMLEAKGLLSPGDHPAEKKMARGKIAYYKACHAMQQGDVRQASGLLREYRTLDMKYFLLYCGTCIPWLWKALHRARR